MTLYHGSEFIIDNPIYGKGRKNNDYGIGFYCTEDEKLASEWAVSQDRDGYVNKYELDVSNLKILNLQDSKYNTLHWITILIQNRIFNIKNDISKEGKKYLVENFNIDLSEYDVVIGYRADDSYFMFAQAFLNNTISVQKLSKALKLGKLGLQVVLVSSKAFSKIKFINCTKASWEEYYELKRRREMEAKTEYINISHIKSKEKNIYLSNLIEKEVDVNDPRLR